MRKILLFPLLVLFVSNLTSQTNEGLDISGELKKWHKITLTFDGPEVSEKDVVNPFLHYRLDVTFYKQGKSYRVPGYFAADGNAAETSANKGNKWRVHFAADEEGKWNYQVSFREGPNVAASESTSFGKSGGFMDGMSGSFQIAPSDKSGIDLRGKGRLQFVDKTYLQFAETKEYFLKAGADAPENLLAYADFDGTFKNDGYKDNFIKTWEAHVKDWSTGDPSWKNGKGKGLIGAINYLSSKGMNAISFLPMNIQGDDQNVFPYVDYHDYTRMDVSKLDQWEMVFEHADKKGMFLHFKSSECENQSLLDQGDLGIHRKLYYRELIARFGHHLALNWNIGEENGKWNFPNWANSYQTTTQRLSSAQYFFENDPYHHHIVIHNGQKFYDLLGPESKYTGLSIQTNRADFGNVHGAVLKWRRTAKDAGKVWANAVDEPGDHKYSLVPDAVNPEHDNARQNALWGALMAGAWGIEWYFGYEHEHSDLTCEDWRTRDKMWDQSKYALDFFRESGVKYWELEPQDNLTEDKNDYVLMKENETYLIYQKMGTKNKAPFKVENGSYSISFFNPRTGMQSPSKVTTVNNGSLRLETPPSDPEKDWAICIKRVR